MQREIRRALTPATASPKANLFFLVDGAETFYRGELEDFARTGFSAPDDRTLVVRLVRPAPHFLAYVASGAWLPVNPRVVERHGAHWTIVPAGTLHTRISRTLSQADPRPAHTGAALRTLLLRELDDRLQTSAHDAFTPRQGLGLEAGNLYGRLSEPLSTVQTAQLMGWTATTTGTILGRLAAAGLVAVEARCWQRTSPEHLDDVALQQGTAGHHRQRAARYALERAAWAWWQAELAALRTRRHTRTRPSSGPKQRPSAACWPAHPRRRNGRADFARARHRLLAAQRLETQRHPQRRPRTETLGQNQTRC